MYPRASAPITPEAYEAANQRAERWRHRYEAAAEELRELRESTEAH